MTIREIILRYESERKELLEKIARLEEELAVYKMEEEDALIKRLEQMTEDAKSKIVIDEEEGTVTVNHTESIEIKFPDNGDSDVPEEKPKPVRRSRKKKTLEE